MHHYRLKKGLNLPVHGAPAQDIHAGPNVTTVALVGEDYQGLKPRLAVQEGDTIAAGAPVFTHKDLPQVAITAPVSGTIKAINRGYRRVLISVEIEIKPDAADPIDFSQTGNVDEVEGLVERLCTAGLWTAFRTRPYSKLADPETRPAAIYITAMDTEPLAPDAAVIINDDPEAFRVGLDAVARLSHGKTYLCHKAGAEIPNIEDSPVQPAAFSGPHPAGLPGTHMHFLEPPDGTKTVWTIWYQDVIAIGRLLQKGQIDPTRIVGITGPLCHKPRLVRTVMGASMVELTQGEYDEGTPARLISGSILSGRAGEGPSAYLGRYDRQVTIIEEDREQITLGWIRPMMNKFSYQPVLGSAFSKKLYALTSNLNGGRRAMVPTGTFEELMPQDFLPTQLLRSLLVMDTDTAQALGVLELDEEDLGLVGFACPAKYEYGTALRDCLTKIEKEG
ncbi:MAG: Na(+)-translocating NADH-quinone reductase subunit A [Pseudomonadota bacterium]